MDVQLTSGEEMKTTRWLLPVMLAAGVLSLPACGDGGGGDDDRTDGGADTDTDTDTDADTDAGPDGGEPFDCEGIECPSGGVLYVDADAIGGETGLSWADAVSDLQLGLAIGGCCAPLQLWVAQGKYLPGPEAEDTFRLIAGVALYGGFSGDELLLSERDAVYNETILSGDIGTSADDFNYSYHVVTGADFAVIDGFTIEGGAAFGEFPNSAGGGMYNESASPTVTGCFFSNNSALDGGGMYNADSSPTVTSCVFFNNYAEHDGSGMYNASSSPTVRSCWFSFNWATDRGGGMYNESASPTVTGCRFSGNSSKKYGSGMANNSSSPTVTNCTFQGNVALEGGKGGGMANIVGSSPTVTNGILWGDKDDDGVSEIYDEGSSSSIVTYSDVQGGWEGEGNIDADPLFVDAESYLSASDWNLLAGSPCIDTGSNDAVPSDVTTDLDGEPRIVDGNDDDIATVDMGAYEVQP